MRLLEYIKTGRGRIIKEEEADKLLATKHSSAYIKHIDIYRSVENYGKYVYIDPLKSKEKRISRNTNNFYTLMIDNFSEWKEFPKRSKSIICTNNFEYASHFSDDVYNVYPENGAKIGVCPTSDIWGAVANCKGYELTFDVVVYIMEDICQLADISGKGDESYQVMINAFKKIDDKKIDELPESFLTGSSYSLSLSALWKEYIESKQTFLKFMQKIMDPNKSGFKIIKAGDKLPVNREVWISAPCVLVKIK